MCLEIPKQITPPSGNIVDSYLNLATDYTELAITHNQCRKYLLGE